MLDMEMEPAFNAQAKIKVIGVGGAGGNAVNRMIEEGLTGVEFISINTDAAALDVNKATKRIQIGTELTKGLGAGANPDMGKHAVEENRKQLEEELKGTDMVFIAAGMGGGTGTGAAPIVAEIARESGALTVAVVTKPFLFEGPVRSRNALSGIDELRKNVDTIIVIQNQKLLTIAAKGAPILESFKTADGVLNDAAKGIAKLITVHGLINVDFADVKAVMTDMGDALMGVGESDDPENRGFIAADAAITSPLLEEIDISGAEGLLVNFTGGEDLSLDDVTAAQERINSAIGDNIETNVIFGAVIDPAMNGRVQVTVVATGFNKPGAKKNLQPTQVQQGQQPKPASLPEQLGLDLGSNEKPQEPMYGGEDTHSFDGLPPVVDIPTAQPVQPQAMPMQSSLGLDPSLPSIDPEDRYAEPAWKRKQAAQEQEQREMEAQQQAQQSDSMIVSKDHSSEQYFTNPNNVHPQGRDGNRDVPAFLRQQMQ